METKRVFTINTIISVNENYISSTSVFYTGLNVSGIVGEADF